MADNELLKKINRELKVTSLENSEKAKIKSENAESEDDEETSDSENNDDVSSDLEKVTDALEEESIENELEEEGEKQIDDIIKDVNSHVLSSDPSLLTNVPLERNEIDDAPSYDGILDDFKQDKTSSFIDPDSGDENDDNRLKVVDTSLGVFTVLSHDDKSVLLLDCNKQKIQISLEDFNNLHPFEIRDERLSTINDFKDAYDRDLKDEKEAEENAENNTDESQTDTEEGFDSGFDDSGFEETEEEQPEEPEESSFGESLNKENKLKENIKKEKSTNLISEIQKKLSQKTGVSETIRSDVRGKNRCILVANKSKSSKDIIMNETKPRQRTKKKSNFVRESKLTNNKNRLKKEVTQPSSIAISPKPLGNVTHQRDFDVKKVLTIKNGKYIFVKLEGEIKSVYLRLKPKKNSLSINELKSLLSNSCSFLESLDIVSNDYYILEKEIAMKKLRKFEAEEVEDLDVVDEVEDDEDDVDVDEEDVEDVDVEDDEDEDSKDDVEDDDSDEDSEDSERDSIEFSTEINGVRYSGTLYRDDSSVEDNEDDNDDVDDEADEEESDEDEENEDDDDLILQSEEELDDLDFPEGLDESVIKARAKIYGKRYNVSFCNVKKESVKRAKIEMRKHNIVEAWNALVRGAKSIKC